MDRESSTYHGDTEAQKPIKGAVTFTSGLVSQQIGNSCNYLPVSSSLATPGVQCAVDRGLPSCHIAPITVGLDGEPPEEDGHVTFGSGRLLPLFYWPTQRERRPPKK